MTKLFEFQRYVTSTMVSMDMSEILRVLREKGNKVRILLNCMAGDAEVVLEIVYRIAIVISTTSVVRFSFILLTYEAVVQQQLILLCRVQC